jgi:hypothetical protein
MSELLPGEFAIRTFKTNNYLSWSFDRHTGTGTVTTSATTLGQTEKFKLTAYTPEYTLIQTLDGQNVTVAPDGQLTLTQGIEETSLFVLVGPQVISEIYEGDPASDLVGFNIRTRNGPFLSAVNGGGLTSNAFLTDVTVAQDWEGFSIVKSGDLGSGYRYWIKPFGQQTMLYLGTSTFTLIQAQVLPPSSGGYVLLTSNGFTYLTAVGGGGRDGDAAAGGESLHTDAWKPLNWEVFNIVDQGDATYFIQTSSGFYLGYAGGIVRTDIGTPDTPPPGWITKFEFLMERTPVHGETLFAIP